MVKKVHSVAFLLILLSVSACQEPIRKALSLPDFAVDSGPTEVTYVTARDGVRLKTAIYKPAGEGPWPALVIRDPYNSPDVFRHLGPVLARYGYVVVHQDVRGRSGSEGEWLPLVNERKDGLDLLQWVIAQPWLDGNIALFGPSYLGAVQWVVADALPPQVKTMVVQIINTNMADALYQDGSFRPELFTFWAALMPGTELELFNGSAYKKWIRHWPHIEGDERFLKRKLPWYREWLYGEDASASIWRYEDAEKLKTVPENTRVPVLSISGWYDLFTRGQLNDFGRLATRDQSRLIVGPWTHLIGLPMFGAEDWPGLRQADVGGKIINWLDHHLKGKPLQAWGPVMTYALGAGQPGQIGWHNHPRWPVTTTEQNLYLAKAAAAEACDGGALLLDRPFSAERVSYTYDPLDPVPTRGGNGMLAFVFPTYSTTWPGNRDQAGLCRRDDVVSFLTPPLERAVHVLGEVHAHLTVASTAGDTAFTAKVVEVRADGSEVNVSDGITTLQRRNGAVADQPYTPGSAVDVDIRLWPAEWVFAPGTRIRLDVSSSNFPAFNAHPNKVEPWFLVREPVRARQTVFSGTDNPARLSLPLWQPAR